MSLPGRVLLHRGRAIPAKSLHTVSAVIELGAGLGLLCFPALSVMLLAGEPLEGVAAVIVTRVGGAGLTTLGIACWMARGDAGSLASRGAGGGDVVSANVAAAGLLAYGGLGAGLRGWGLWPGVMLHAVMTAWCIASLQRRGPGPLDG